VYTKFNLLSLALFALLILEHCKAKTNTDKSNDVSILPTLKTDSLSGFDTIIQQLKTMSELVKEDLLALNIDTFYSYKSTETSYCDTTVQLNDSVFYSLVELSDEGGVCSHTFIVTVNEKQKKTIASKYLHPDCDVDYSWDSYDLYDHQIISQDSILLIKTTIFQKKNKSSTNEEENIDHKQIQKFWFTILATGQINSPDKIFD
jgi:hypothetical protein